MRTGRVLTRVLMTGALALTACATEAPPSSGRPTPTAVPATSPAASATGTAPPADSRAATPAPWPGYHRGGAHRGVSPDMPPAGTLHVVARKHLDGEVYASPIVAEGTVVVATENDTVYGMGTAGRVRWRRHLGSPSPASQRPCGNIDPLGITGTPVYSPATGDVYVAMETGTHGVHHTLVALDTRTGRVHWRRTLDFPGVETRAMQQRGALALAGGRVWVPFGGLAGDCGGYKGRVVGIPVRGRGTALRYTVPTRREAGIWQASGPAVDSQGHLLVSVGNGASLPGDRYDHSDSVLQLSNRRARVQQFFAPREWAADNAGDVDLGSVGPALVGTRWIVQGGKSDRVYVLRQGRLGGIGGQRSVARIAPAYGGAAVDGNVVYLPCVDGVRALRVTSTGRLRVLWRTATAAPGSPVVGGGRVWVLDPDAGRLYALSPTTGRSRAHVWVGHTSRFATPALYGDRVIVPTYAGVTIVRE